MLQTGSQHGMQSMDACLSDLIRQGIISPHVALERAGSSAELKRLLESQGLTRPSTAKAA